MRDATRFHAEFVVELAKRMDERFTKQQFIEELGKRVRQIRLDRQLTQKQLAKRTGLSNVQICLIENGRHAASARTVCALAMSLNIQPTELIPKISLRVRTTLEDRRKFVQIVRANLERGDFVKDTLEFDTKFYEMLKRLFPSPGHRVPSNGKNLRASRSHQRRSLKKP
jgi:transcriptional regulator with XRE-family HTH domain